MPAHRFLDRPSKERYTTQHRKRTSRNLDHSSRERYTTQHRRRTSKHLYRSRSRERYTTQRRIRKSRHLNRSRSRERNYSSYESPSKSQDLTFDSGIIATYNVIEKEYGKTQKKYKNDKRFCERICKKANMNIYLIYKYSDYRMKQHYEKTEISELIIFNEFVLNKKEYSIELFAKNNVKNINEEINLISSICVNAEIQLDCREIHTDSKYNGISDVGHKYYYNLIANILEASTYYLKCLENKTLERRH